MTDVGMLIDADSDSDDDDDHGASNANVKHLSMGYNMYTHCNECQRVWIVYTFIEHVFWLIIWFSLYFFGIIVPSDNIFNINTQNDLIAHGLDITVALVLLIVNVYVAPRFIFFFEGARQLTES